MIVGLIQADSGRVLLDQKDMTQLPIHDRARHGLSYLPQESSIFRNLTVEENVLAILQARQELSREQTEEKLEQLLEEFSIEHIRHSKGMSLSGGERRRTEIARTLATDPKFILLDEPFAGVDPISVSDIKTIINWSASHQWIEYKFSSRCVRYRLSEVLRIMGVDEHAG